LFGHCFASRHAQRMGKPYGAYYFGCEIRDWRLLITVGALRTLSCRGARFCW
jgi:hypothetical protein